MSSKAPLFLREIKSLNRFIENSSADIIAQQDKMLEKAIEN
jgi:hypothetical protein